MTATSGIVILCFAVLIALEEAMRGERASAPPWQRMATNWGLGAINIALAAFLPIAPILAAAWSGPGLLTGWPAALAFIPLLLVRSISAYWLHRLLHVSRWLWRFHKVHHCETVIDCTTGLRNHPFEVLAAIALAAAAVLALAPPLPSVVAVEAVLLIASFWQHAAIRLPERLTRSLEWVVITPRLHLLHHSQARADHDSNFGDIFSFWDRLFGSFAPPRMDPISVGLADEGQFAQSLRHQLAAPFAHNK